MSQDHRPRLPDPVRSALRAAVAAVDRAVAAAPADGLAAAWRDLVALLALGPEPEYRECPTCHAIGMREAKVCGHCWTALTPQPKIGRDSEGAPV